MGSAALHFVWFVLVSHFCFSLLSLFTVASLFFLSSWEKLLRLPPLLFSLTTCLNLTMSDRHGGQVKLCPYHEEEPAICLCLIEAQFVAAAIESQKLRYANPLASLPKQALQEILDTVDVCNESDQPFDLLKEVLLGQFVRSKWQSYFDLLWLRMEMQASSPAFSWENSNNSSPMASAQTVTFSFQCF